MNSIVSQDFEDSDKNYKTQWGDSYTHSSINKHKSYYMQNEFHIPSR